jgi:hypothetical protein
VPPPALVPPAPAGAFDGSYGNPYGGSYDAATMPGFPAAAPRPPRNRLALLGVILAVPFWPAGLVLSTLGLFNAIKRRTGKIMAVIGLVLSILMGGAVVAELAVATSAVASSTALDPGCAAIESDLSIDMETLKSDTASLAADEDSATSSSASIVTLNSDLSAIQGDVTVASGDATNADVKSDLDTMDAQIQSVGTALDDVQNHSTSSEGAAAAALTTLQSADAHLDALCASY